MTTPIGPLAGRIAVRQFKWPRRYTGMAVARLLGDDAYGRWVGVAQGDPWWRPDGSLGGAFITSLVKVVPTGAYWSACFQPVDPIVDVDIILPVRWVGAVLEEIDLELDVLRAADGRVWVRDEDVFAQVRADAGMPADIAATALATCARVRALLEAGAEPFGTVGRDWLARFLVKGS